MIGHGRHCSTSKTVILGAWGSPALEATLEHCSRQIFPPVGQDPAASAILTALSPKAPAASASCSPHTSAVSQRCCTPSNTDGLKNIINSRYLLGLLLHCHLTRLPDILLSTGLSQTHNQHTIITFFSSWLAGSLLSKVFIPQWQLTFSHCILTLNKSSSICFGDWTQMHLTAEALYCHCSWNTSVCSILKEFIAWCGIINK